MTHHFMPMCPVLTSTPGQPGVLLCPVSGQVVQLVKGRFSFQFYSHVIMVNVNVGSYRDFFPYLLVLIFVPGLREVLQTIFLILYGEFFTGEGGECIPVQPSRHLYFYVHNSPTELSNTWLSLVFQLWGVHWRQTSTTPPPGVYHKFDRNHVWH